MHINPISLIRICVFCPALILTSHMLTASSLTIEDLDEAPSVSIDAVQDISLRRRPTGVSPLLGPYETGWPPLNSFQKWSRRIGQISLSLSPRSSDVIGPEERPVASLDLGAGEPPDIDTLRELIAERPYDLGSLSIGAPDAGLLFNGFTFTSGPLWHVRDSRDAWATEETLAFVAAAIRAVESSYPGSPSLCIGDLSRRQGGPIDRHRSHQSGRDVDLGWYFKEGSASNLCKGDVRRLDLPRCWALVRALVMETDIERIFIDRRIQRALYRYALESGENRDWLERLFENPGGRRDTLIQHVRGHKSHLHARFYNRRAQEWGRLAYPLLIEAGLAPPPVVMHRARRGDTLSAIARRYGTSVTAIRRANRLRSTLIRAGRRYRIPTRLTAAAKQEPLIVPPRRLPPTPFIIADTSDVETSDFQNRLYIAEEISREQTGAHARAHINRIDEPSLDNLPTKDASMTK